MSFFSRLFKKQAHTSIKASTQELAQQRVNELEELSTEALVELIRSQSKPLDWQTDAIARLPFDGCLIELINATPTPKCHSAALRRAASLMDSEEISLEVLKQSISEPLLQTAIASYCSETKLLVQLIDELDDPQGWALLCSQGLTAKVRIAAAENLVDIDLIKSVAPTLKNKDKNVYRILKARLDAHRDQQRIQAETDSKLADICDSLGALLNQYDQSQLEQRLERLRLQWQDLANTTQVSEELQTRYKQATSACEVQVAKQLEQYKLEAAEAERVVKAKGAYEPILEEVALFAAALYGSEQAPDEDKAAEFVRQQQAAWQLAEQACAPNRQQVTAFGQYIEHIDKAQSLMAEHGSVASQLSKLKIEREAGEPVEHSVTALNQYLRAAQGLKVQALPPVIVEAKSLLAEIKNEIRKENTAKKDRIRLLDALVRKGNGAIDRGSLRQACGIRKSISEKLLADESLPPKTQRQLELLDDAIEKLQGYRDFSVEPKKQQLIAGMTALVDASKVPTVDAEDLADKIQKLQSDWKELVYGGKDMQPELWEQFQGLSREAYIPCEAYFAERAGERKRNLEKRQTLAASLQNYLEQYQWEQANWKDVEHIVRKAKEEWASYSPVDRGANTPVQKKFYAATKAIQKLINADYQRVKERKQSIVDSAEKLIQLEDLSEAIEQVKQLQQEWKNSGRTWQRDENKLWAQLRIHSDAVFARKNEELVAFKEELEATRQQAESLCVQLEGLLGSSAVELLAAKAQVAELSQAFYALGALPRNASAALKQRFSHAVNAYEEQLKRYRNSQKQHSWQSVYRINQLINDWQLQVLREGKESESAETALAQIEEFSNSIDKWPAGTKNAIDAKMSAPIEHDLESEEKYLVENASALRLLCIRLEIAVDVSTPVEDQPLRLEFQVNRLKQGLGSAGIPQQELVNGLLFEWFSAGPVEPAEYEILWQRFHALLV